MLVQEYLGLKTDSAGVVVSAAVVVVIVIVIMTVGAIVTVLVMVAIVVAAVAAVVVVVVAAAAAAVDVDLRAEGVLFAVFLDSLAAAVEDAILVVGKGCQGLHSAK